MVEPGEELKLVFDKAITDSIMIITPTTGINVMIEIFPNTKNK